MHVYIAEDSRPNEGRVAIESYVGVRDRREEDRDDVVEALSPGILSP